MIRYGWRTIGEHHGNCGRLRWRYQVDGGDDYETLTVTVDRAIINEQGGLATGTVRRSNTDIARPGGNTH